MAGFGSNLNSSGPVIGYNPLSVGMKPGTSPYLGSISNTSKLASTSPFSAQQKPPTQNLGAQGILATGKGPGRRGLWTDRILLPMPEDNSCNRREACSSTPSRLGRVSSGRTWEEDAPSTGIPQTLLGQAQGGAAIFTYTTARASGYEQRRTKRPARSSNSRLNSCSQLRREGFSTNGSAKQPALRLARADRR